MKVYIAGPMTGLPNHNFEAFNAAAEAWRQAGWEVVNPAELDAHTGLSHEELAKRDKWWYYERDFGYFLGWLPHDSFACEEEGNNQFNEFRPQAVDAIALLPGWESSEGAQGELYMAKLLRKRVFDALHVAHPPITTHEFVDGTNLCCNKPDYAHMPYWKEAR